MIIVRVVIGGLKVLMVLGLVEFVAPGLSYEVSKELTNSLFKLAGRE